MLHQKSVDVQHPCPMSCSPLSLKKHQNQSIDANDNDATHESIHLQCNGMRLLNATLPRTRHQHCNQTITASLNGCMFCKNYYATK